MKLFTDKQTIEEKRFIISLIFPVLMAFIMFVVKLVETLEGWEFNKYGIRPHTSDGLVGIVLSPLIHGDWGHLWANITSFLVLSVTLFYLYRGVAIRVFVFIYLFSGFFVWLVARDSYHIGSSGLIYGMAAFLFFSGIIRSYIPLMAISLVVVFLYGSFVWGILPLHVNLPYSWEGHLGGTLAGIFLSVFWRRKGPQKPKKIWDDDPEDDDDYWNRAENP